MVASDSVSWICQSVLMIWLVGSVATCIQPSSYGGYASKDGWHWWLQDAAVIALIDRGSPCPQFVQGHTIRQND